MSEYLKVCLCILITSTFYTNIVLNDKVHVLVFIKYLVNWVKLCSSKFLFVVGIVNRITIDITRAITPPSLFGIDRRIAYANWKHHSD